MPGVLNLFLPRMAERSSKKKNYGQSYMYLRSAENLITLVEDMNYECSEARQVVMKLRERVNYSLYIKDYWAISYGHPGLGMHSSMDLSRRPSMLLPNLPDMDNNSNDNISNKNNSIDNKNKNNNKENILASDILKNNCILKSHSINMADKRFTKAMVDVELTNSREISTSEDIDGEFTRL